MECVVDRNRVDEAGYDAVVTRVRSRLQIAYAAATGLIGLYLATILALRGADGLTALMLRGPASNLHVTLLSLGFCWLLAGAFIGYSLPLITRQNVLAHAGFYLCCFLFANLMRERLAFPDLPDYVLAAIEMQRGDPLHSRYLYPPLWATLLQPFAPYGAPIVASAGLAINYVSIAALFILLHRVLLRYGFCSNLAGLLVAIALGVGVPIHRTLVYGQINFLVVALVLGCLLLATRRPVSSALILSVAVHLKLSPAIFVLPFLALRNWRWLLSFAGGILAVMAFTSAVNDSSYYLDFLAALGEVRSANTLTLRDLSIDGLVRNLATRLEIREASATMSIFVLKGALAVATLYFAARDVREKTWYRGEAGDDVVLNACILLMFLQTMLAPLVWPHHLVMLVLPTLVLLKKLETTRDWTLYGVACFFVYLLPVFDFYPISYVRFVGVAILYVLLVSATNRPRGDSTSFERLNRELSGRADAVTLRPIA